MLFADAKFLQCTKCSLGYSRQRIRFDMMVVVMIGCGSGDSSAVHMVHFLV